MQDERNDHRFVSARPLFFRCKHILVGIHSFQAAVGLAALLVLVVLSCFGGWYHREVCTVPYLVSNSSTPTCTCRYVYVCVCACLFVSYQGMVFNTFTGLAIVHFIESQVSLSLCLVHSILSFIHSPIHSFTHSFLSFFPSFILTLYFMSFDSKLLCLLTVNVFGLPL